MSTSEKRRSRLTFASGNVVVVGAVLMIIGLVVGALHMKRLADARSPGGNQGETAQLPEVEAVEVATRQIPIVFDVRGFLEGFEEVTVHAEASGRIVQKPVEDGQPVEQGTVLCSIDETLYHLAEQKAEASLSVAQSQHREAESALEVARAQQRDAKAAHDNAKAEFERIENLYRDKHSLEIEYDRYETQFRRAEARLCSAKAAYKRAQEACGAAEAAVEVARVVLAEAREMLSRCQVRAPIAGTINQTRYEAGECVVAGQPLVEIIRLDKMKLIVNLTGAQVGTLGHQSQAEVSVDAVPGATYQAMLSHVAPKSDPLTRKFRVEFHLDNPDGRLRAGMFSRARIESATWQNVTAARREVFFRKFGADFCFVIVEEDGSLVARLRQVTLEDIPGRFELVRVAEGLTPGDRLVIKRPRHLKDATRVSVKN